MTMRLASVAKLVALLGILAGSATAQVNPGTVLNGVNKALAGAGAQDHTPASRANNAKPLAAKPAAPQAAASASAPAQAPASPAAPGAAPDKIAKRDPFGSLLNKPTGSGGGNGERLPPGIPGLVIDALRIDGIVKGANGMIAIVSNPQQRVYFIHEGDKLYDGTVEHITLEAVAFHEVGKDAFGRPTDRDVTKRLYPSPGEEQ